MLAGGLWWYVCVSMVVGTNAGPLDAMSFVVADIVISLVVATVKTSITTIRTIATTNEPAG